MRVDTPTLLAVLAHEIRGPVSVLQGYLRLLEQRRGTGDPEAATIDAMRRSTTRLATLGREASDLSGWLQPDRRSKAERVPLGQLLSDVVARTALAQPRDPLPETLSAMVLATEDRTMLARALAALVLAVSRDFDNRRCAIDVRTDERCAILEVAPEVPADSAQGAPPASLVPAFGRGGMGLELVIASHVLASHGARVQTAAHGGMTIHLPFEEARQ
jgi:signal transduction histidine kinase